MPKQLSIITLTWNSGEFIAEQIRSVQAACEGVDYEQIVIDNGSHDQTVQIIKKDFPDIILIENKENRGFAEPNNDAMKRSTGEFLLFLNPDMKLAPCSMKTLLDWMRAHTDVGIASVKLTDIHGNFNEDTKPRRFPKVWELVATILKIPHIFPRILDTYKMKGFDPHKEQEVDSVRGAFMFMRRELINKTGFAFDPRYFIWFEDVDTCREAKRFGMKVMYTPIISAVDLFGQSFKKRTTLWKQKQMTKSMIIYTKKWEPWWKWMWVWLTRPVGIILGFFADLFV